MLNAAIKECPVQRGKIKSFDAAKVANMPGVKKVLQVGNSAVAVVADTWWQAKVALDALPIEWDPGENAKVSSASIAEWLKAGLDAPEAFVGNSNGDATAALASAAKKVEAVYAYPFQNHACMEPMNATALYTADKCEVWVPTQNGEAAFGATVQASGLPANKCEVYKQHLGGGFGRRGAFHDYVTQAVLIAKEMPGTPIKLLWSREEDMAQGRFHPVMQAKLVGGFDKDNNLTALHVRLSGQSIVADVFPQNLDKGDTNPKNKGMDPNTFQGLQRPGQEHAFGYTIPNLLIDHAMRNPHIKPGFWRGVNINQNAIFMECFMDELAQSVGQDELEFRRKLLTGLPRNRAVLDAVAERIGWGKPAPQGVFRGLAQMMAFDSYVAAAAEISVTGNKLKVLRIVGGTDCDLRGQSGADRPAGRGLVRLRAVGTVLPGMHRQGRRHRADQLRQLQLDAHRRDAEGRVGHRPLGRQCPLGRRRRAHHLRGSAGGDECVLQGHRPAHPLVPAEEPQHRNELAIGAAAARRAAVSPRPAPGRR